MNPPDPYITLTGRPQPRPTTSQLIEKDYNRAEGIPTDVPLYHYILDRYGIDLASEYAGFPIAQPIGKASGQLSMTARQVADDVTDGLGFVVLKTVIAQDEHGDSSMDAWAIQESRMVVEEITSRGGTRGWTISWKGRGWWRSFDEYLKLFRDSLDVAASSNTLIVPSVKFHLPATGDEHWRKEEYYYTVGRLLEIWGASSRAKSPMPLEKDFSPTLAGSDRIESQRLILDWVQTVPQLVHEASQPREVRLGLKMFNALFNEAFQVDMLAGIHSDPESRPDFFVYGNRLFDPDREFDGHRGIAYGGYDLSDRNLRSLDAFRATCDADSMLQWSATGNIVTGQLALEYALRGATSFQLHTYFQLPATEYSLCSGSKVHKALHELYFHPHTGMIVWLDDLASRLSIPRNPLRFRDVVGRIADV